jgi:hypothetical protein
MSILDQKSNWTRKIELNRTESNWPYSIQFWFYILTVFGLIWFGSAQNRKNTSKPYKLNRTEPTQNRTEPTIFSSVLVLYTNIFYFGSVRFGSVFCNCVSNLIYIIILLIELKKFISSQTINYYYIFFKHTIMYGFSHFDYFSNTKIMCFRWINTRHFYEISTNI